MVYSLRGLGKTLLGMSSAYAIAAGADFLGFSSSRKPRKILYIGRRQSLGRPTEDDARSLPRRRNMSLKSIPCGGRAMRTRRPSRFHRHAQSRAAASPADGEMPAETMQERLAAIVGGIRQQPPANDFFRILISDLCPLGLPDLATLEGQGWIDAQVDNAEVLILDNISTNGHRETWSIRAKGFRRWLARRFFEATQGAPSSEALQSALNVIEAKAHFDAPERTVHIRVGGLDGRLYLDLCDATWRAVGIDATGWRVIENPPVRFRRAAGMQPLPMPVRGGLVETLRLFLNVKSHAVLAPRASIKT